MQARTVALILLVCMAGALMVENAEAYNYGGGHCRCRKWCYKYEYPRGRCGWTKYWCCRRWGLITANTNARIQWDH